jgi:hypothetical protein
VAFNFQQSGKKDHFIPLSTGEQQQPASDNDKNLESLEADRILAIRQSPSITAVQWNLNTKNSLIQNPHVAAAALKRITQLLVVPSSTSRQDHDPEDRSQKVLLPSLLATIKTFVNTTEGTLFHWNAAADALVSLSILQTHRRGNNAIDGDMNFQPLAQSLWDQLENNETEKVASTVKPRILLACLRAADTFQLCLPNQSSPLCEAICKRVVQGDALSKLKPRDLVGMLMVLGREDYGVVPVQVDLVIAFLRRLRKQTVRSAMDRDTRSRVLGAIRQLLQRAPRESTLHSEVSLAAYTLGMYALKTETQQPLVGSEATILLQITSDLKLDGDPMVELLQTRLVQDADSILETATLNQLGQLSSVFLQSEAMQTEYFARQLGRKFAESVHSPKPRWLFDLLRGRCTETTTTVTTKALGAKLVVRRPVVGRSAR